MEDKFSFKKGHRARAIFLIADYLILSIAMIFIILPILKVLVDSVDPTSTYGMRLWPKVIDFGAYKQIMSNQSLYRPFMVSVVTTVVGTVVGLLIVTISAYVIIQKEMPGRKFFVNMILFTMMFNGGLVPTFLTVKAFGLMESMWAVILPLTLNAYNIILMKSFFESIPNTLYEAAELDGCTPIGIFWRIILPLSKPALASIGLFIAVTMWNDFFHFQIYIHDPLKQNFQLKLREMIMMESMVGTANTGSVTGEMMKSAVIVVVITPFLVIYPFLQKYFVKGVTLGAVKG
jgi:putative aldouronate transport system permease protein